MTFAVLMSRHPADVCSRLDFMEDSVVKVILNMPPSWRAKC
jgi:hypothetical protein